MHFPRRIAHRVCQSSRDRVNYASLMRSLFIPPATFRFRTALRAATCLGAAASLLVSSLTAPRSEAAETSLPLPPPGPPIDPANLDRNVKPSDDFFAFAGGGWLAKNPIPGEYARWGSFEILAERNNEVLRSLLDDCASHPGEPGSVQQKVGDFYASGMDVATVDAAGAKPLSAELDAIAKVSDRAALPAAVARLQRIGLTVLFNLNADADDKNSRMTITQLYQGGLGLPDRDYYTKEDEKSKALRQDYVAHVAKMFTLLGDDAAKAEVAAKAVLNFETELAKASKTRVERRDPEANYHKMGMADLVKLAPGFDWQAYFTAMGVPEPGEIDVKQTEFFTEVGKLASSASLDDWKTYLRWHLVRDTAPDLSQAFVDENFRFFGATLTGAKENRPRWKRVLREVDADLGEALGQLFVDKAFTPEAKARAKAMVEDLRTVLSERINKLEWMSPETKTQAQKKLAAFAVKIGYPDKWRDYAKLDIKRQPHVLNVFAANAFEVQRNLAKIGKPVDRTEWGMTPPTVNAYYNQSNNEIVFPAGILQSPFFDAKADDAVNYGAIGAVIGHEMTHGFDDQGRQYDAEGNLKNWWTEEDAKRYKERSEAVVSQFDAYRPLPDATINGRLTQGENIADLGGLKIAYEALQRALARQGGDATTKKIDDFTPAQRFFLSWANVWRNNIRPEALRLRLNTDPHAPGHYRVNGPLSNLPEFSAAFQVPPGSPMARPEKERVLIW